MIKPYEPMKELRTVPSLDHCYDASVKRLDECHSIMREHNALQIVSMYFIDVIKGVDSMRTSSIHDHENSGVGSECCSWKWLCVKVIKLMVCVMIGVILATILQCIDTTTHIHIPKGCVYSMYDVYI